MANRTLFKAQGNLFSFLSLTLSGKERSIFSSAERKATAKKKGTPKKAMAFSAPLVRIRVSKMFNNIISFSGERIAISESLQALSLS